MDIHSFLPAATAPPLSALLGRPWSNPTLHTPDRSPASSTSHARDGQYWLWADGQSQTLPSDRDFIGMRNHYRASGGVARGPELAHRLDGADGQGAIRLARMIVAVEIFSFDWHDTFWVPMFQLNPQTLTVSAGAREVSGELCDDFDGWSLALWFSQPNGWLRDQRPVDLLTTELPAVLAAARADRIIATG